MKNQIEIYKSKNGQTQVEVKFDKETVWLNQKQMAVLFDKDTDTIGLHLKNIFNEGELGANSTTEDFSVVQQESGLPETMSRGNDKSIFCDDGLKK